MSEHPSVCMFMTSFSHSHVPRGPDIHLCSGHSSCNQSPKRRIMLCVALMHGEDMYAVCNSLTQTKDSRPPSNLAPSTWDNLLLCPSCAAAALGFPLHRLPFAGAIACLIFSCRQKSTCWNLSMYDLFLQANDALNGFMLNGLWIHLIAECIILTLLLYVMHNRHSHSEDHAFTCWHCPLCITKYTFQT